jgi:hypothetical protein
MKRVASIVCGSLAVGLLVACTGQTVIGGTGTNGSGGDTGTGGGSGSGGSGAGAPSAPADKVDLLLVIDNSRSMADKQQILALAVYDLVGGLANPRCLDGSGQPVVPQPSSPTEPCPAGSAREFLPVHDVHVGVITTSLGGHGSDACPASDQCTGGTNTSNDDRGHLIARTDPCAGGSVPTYNGLGFLAWDPTQQLSPPGETDVNAFTAHLADMVVGAGQIGCGFEAQLESWYRFLADPAPHDSIAIVDGHAQKSGVDQALLQQRADFLRPDSALVIVMLTDENDCSVIEDGQYYFANQLSSGSGQFHLPRARSECATNPNDPCCKSCGEAQDGCPADPSCDEGGGVLTTLDDAINLRCWEQKRRFGIDFLYPVQRYVNALTQPMLDPAQYDLAGSAVPNPIFSDLAGSGAPVRGPDLVFFAGIVGVPWQAIAVDPSNVAKGYKPATQLDWSAILGDPANHVQPTDPHMIESIDPRPGLPTSGLADPVHGHEWTIDNRDDLQYACSFELPNPVDCSDPGYTAGCDCHEVGNDNPLCGGPDGTLQVRAKGYPGLRHLSVIQGLGAQGVVGSICADVTPTPESPAFGYRPAVGAIIQTVKNGLAQ